MKQAQQRQRNILIRKEKKAVQRERETGKIGRTTLEYGNRHHTGGATF
jgi:hypothetical protein